MAKSAQFPLHVWLPDAWKALHLFLHLSMQLQWSQQEYLVARLQPLYSIFPSIQFIIALVGTITCFLGASIA